MGKIQKSTKRFAKKHLSEEISRRRKTKQIKAQRLKGKRQNLDEDEEEPARTSGRGAEALQSKSAKKKIEDLDVDELLRGDFLEDPDEDAEKSVDGSAGSGDEEEASDDANLSEEAEEDDFVDITPLGAEGADDSSEEEIEDGTSTVRGQNKRLSSDVEKHKRELEALKKKDPEFYKFLEEHDQELLQFDDEEGDEVAEEEEGDAVEEKGRSKGKSKREKGTADTSESQEVTRGKGPEGRVLTSAMVDAWADSVLNKHSSGAVKYLLQAFRTACHYGDGEGEEMSSSISIASSHVFSKVMLLVLREMDGILRRMLAPVGTAKVGGAEEEGPPPYPAAPQKSPRWKKVEPLAKSYLGNALHVLGQMTDGAMIAFALRRLRTSVPLLAAFPKFARKYLKLALHFWATEEEGALPVVAAVFVREIAVLLGPDWLEACLRGAYRSFAANCKFVNAAALPRVDFMSRFLVELYSLDPVGSYQQAFIFIRQLALILRTALTNKTQESCRAVYSWQFMSCLGAWVRVLSMHGGTGSGGKSDSLQLLVYPLTQIITGTAQLVPTARYFPLRVQCARMLNCLAASTSQFVPVAPLLLGMLSFSDLHKAPTGGAGKPSDFTTILKVPKQIIKTRAFQEDCVASVMESLAEHLSQWAYSVAFPELVVVPLVQLRRFAKETPVERFRRQTKQLIHHIEQNVEFVLRKRETVGFAPKDASAVADFLADEKAKNVSPMAQYASNLVRQAEEKRRNLRSKDIVFGGRGGKRGRDENGVHDAEPSGNPYGKKRSREHDEDEDEEQHVDTANTMEEDEGLVEKEGEAAFGKGWLPSKKNAEEAKKGAKKEKRENGAESGDEDDDVVEDLVFSDDEDGEGPTARDGGEGMGDEEESLPKVSRKKKGRVGGDEGNGTTDKVPRKKGKGGGKSEGTFGGKVRKKVRA